jgi:hypothetical protein
MIYYPMRNINTFFALLFLISFQAIPCSFDEHRLDEAYRNSNVVISGKVISVSTYSLDSTLLRVEFEPYETFKGKPIQEFFIENPRYARSMCVPYFNDGDEILIYSTKLPNSLNYVGYGDRKFPLNYLKIYPRELEILRALRELDWTETTSFNLNYRKSDFFDKLFWFESNSTITEVAILEVTFDPWNYLTDARFLIGFDPELDEKIIEFAEKSTWSFEHYGHQSHYHLYKFIVVLKNETSHIFGQQMISQYRFQ